VVRWHTGNGSDGLVYVSQDGAGEFLFARGPSGSAVADWVGSGSAYEFRLYSGTSDRALLATATVRGDYDVHTGVEQSSAVPESTLSASPNPVPPGFWLGDTVLSWDTGDGSVGRLVVSVDGGADALVAIGVRGSARASWIDVGREYRFTLYRDGSEGRALRSVVVTRRPRSLAIASTIAALSAVVTAGLVGLLGWRVLSISSRSGPVRGDATAPAKVALLALALHFVIYRWLLSYEIAAAMSDDFLAMLDWNDQFWVARVIGYAAKDLVIAVGLSAAAWLVSRAWPRPQPRLVRRIGEAVLVVALAAVGLASAAHLRMVMELRAGLDIPALFETSAALGGDLDDFVQWSDLALAVSPVALYVLFRSRLGPSGQWTGTPMLMGAVAVAGIGVLHTGPDAQLLTHHPVVAIARQTAWRPDLGTDHLPPLHVDPALRPGFVDSALVRAVPGEQAEGFCRPARRPTSLLLVVVEALAMRQIASPEGEIGPAMPHFARLAAEGWWLRNHRASANASPQAAFSLFTGLSSFPELSLSVTSARFWMPAIWTRLPMHERFLLTPMNLRGFFPLGLVQRDGLGEIVDYDELKPFTSRPHAEAAINELDGVDALVRRLQATTGRPFFGTYLSHGTHAPYFDADPARRMIAEPTDDRERYLNAVRNFDNQLQRIVQALEQAGHGDDTLLVVVADHGQAFGEHGAWQHGRSSWEEVLHVPALIWQPSAVEQRIDSRFTTHADLLPTILELLGVPFDPIEFQGESLCDPELRRRYVFANAREGVVTSWDVATHTKLSWNHLTGECRRVELATDPHELRALPCDARAAQLDATKRFYVSQRTILLNYAASRLPRD
jgi:hypothetical protein